jgi:hypothetical protein
LELCILLVEFIHIKRHVANDKSIKDRTKDQHSNSYKYFGLSPRSNLANSKKIEGKVKTHNVGAHPVAIVVVVDLVSAEPNEVAVGDPSLFLDNDVVPETPHHVDEHKHHENQVNHFVSSFRSLARIQIQNHIANASKS